MFAGHCALGRALTAALGARTQASFWSAEEIDLSADMKHWMELSENERFFIGRVLVRVCAHSPREPPGDSGCVTLAPAAPARAGLLRRIRRHRE
jgi:hypothetical protein